MNELSLLTGADSKGEKLYVDSVFSAYTHTGNGSTQTINNGIDLVGKGGMVWIKGRTLAYSHYLADTTRGPTKPLFSNLTSAEQTYANSVTGFNSNGFTMGSDSSGLVNYAGGYNYVSWTFAKAPKFFDIVAYTGNGTYSRLLPHTLGISPGMILVKRTDSAGDWFVYHKYLGYSNNIRLNTTAAYVGWTNGDYPWGGPTGGSDATTANFMVGGASSNANGATYVAYLFAHDTSADGIIQCGSYTGNGSATGPVVNLGWEPQFILAKGATSSGYNWVMVDSMRGSLSASDSGLTNYLAANSANAETGINPPAFAVSATGFRVSNNGGQVNESGTTYIYLAIRRPNKPPITGTQVYNAIARTGTGAAATVTGVGFAPDLAAVMTRVSGSFPWTDRLRGATQSIITNGSDAEITATSTTNITAFGMDGVSIGTNSVFSFNTSGSAYINHFFKRAPGVFDVVCYTGTGADAIVPHGLGVAPELCIIKSRVGDGVSFAATGWLVHSPTVGTGIGLYGFLNTTASFNLAAGFATAKPTTTSLFLSTSSETNGGSGNKYVAYLFASKLGISKVGSYTGNGTSQTINCSFTTGARFILIKRTDSTGDWYIWDTVRGIIGGNDPHLSLNSTAAEITTDDSIDPDTTGFIVNQVAATNINVNSGSYIFLAIA